MSSKKHTSKAETIKPLPEPDKTKPPGIQKRMKNLVQYSGKKKEECVVLDEEEQNIEQIKTELSSGESIDVPAVPINTKQTLPITVKAVLGPEELKVYVNEVEAWFCSHPDWDHKEDLDDIHGIAMEKVLQFRLLLKKKNHPRSNIEKDYNSSVYRMQGFRQNLAARRADRISNKGAKVMNQTNIAIIASKIDDAKMEEMEKIVKVEEEEEKALLGELVDE
jgi:hypothetical protein